MHTIGRKIAVIASVFSCFSLVAQEADPVIMTVNGKKIQKSEFELGGWYDIADLPSSTAPHFIDVNANNTFHRHTAEEQ